MRYQNLSFDPNNSVVLSVSHGHFFSPASNSREVCFRCVWWLVWKPLASWGGIWAQISNFMTFEVVRWFWSMWFPSRTMCQATDAICLQTLIFIWTQPIIKVCFKIYVHFVCKMTCWKTLVIFKIQIPYYSNDNFPSIIWIPLQIRSKIWAPNIRSLAFELWPAYNFTHYYTGIILNLNHLFWLVLEYENKTQLKKWT